MGPISWTTPRTWVAGEVVTAAIGNTHWRDNQKWLHGDSGGVTLIDQVSSGGGQMRAHRHPYANDRHVESGTAAFINAANATTTDVAVAFTDGFSTTPVLAMSLNSVTANNVSYGHAGLSATNFSARIYNGTGGLLSLTLYWIAEGPD